MIGLYMNYGYGGMYGLYGMYFDPTYILIVIAAVITIIAQYRVNSTYNKYARVYSTSGMTGAMAAEKILRSQGIYDVSIRRVSGKLSDHYNPKDKTLNLSDAVYNDSSVASIGVAAHECGHAIQHARGYAPLSIRAALVPVANIGSQLSWAFIILGIIMGTNQILLNIGILMFSAAVLFQLVTLPVEFNASGRALKILEGDGLIRTQEVDQARKVLSAAALTYVAAAASAILQLLRLIILFGGKDRKRD